MIDAPNGARFEHASKRGFYESFFLRGNHPKRPQAFWIRYTSYCPRGRPADAVGQLWAIWFDGDTGRHVAVRREVPFERCRFDPNTLDVRIDDATLDERSLSGDAGTIGWNLSYRDGGEPLLLLPPRLYTTSLPKAKALVPRPMAVFDGTVTVEGTPIRIDAWVGSQNHNWGTQHADRYVWGQVAGFDDDADAFLEVASVRISIGPVLSPPLTPVVLRVDGAELRLNGVSRTVRNFGSLGGGTFTFRAEDRATRIEGWLSAPVEAFVGLRYENPPGGTKLCLNSKIAGARVIVTHDGTTKTLSTRHRAAFEILSDQPELPVPVRV